MYVCKQKKLRDWKRHWTRATCYHLRYCSSLKKYSQNIYFLSKAIQVLLLLIFTVNFDQIQSTDTEGTDLLRTSGLWEPILTPWFNLSRTSGSPEPILTPWFNLREPLGCESLFWPHAWFNLSRTSGSWKPIFWTLNLMDIESHVEILGYSRNHCVVRIYIESPGAWFRPSL